MYSQTVTLVGQTINNFAPFELTINPSNISLSKKIRQIDYIWGDDTTTSILYKPDPSQDLNPKNYPQTKKFLSKDPSLSVYYITVNVYTFGSAIPNTYYITLNLKPPILENYFDNVHLIKTRMFGVDNEIIYTFETQNDNTVLLSLVNWRLKPKVINAQQLNRPYEIVPPFAQQFKNNKNTNVIPSPDIVPYNSEDNTTINRLYP